LLDVLYGCGNWFLSLKEEHNLRVFGDRLLKEIFGLKGKEAT